MLGGCYHLLYVLFEDKRLTCVLLMSWMILVLAIFSELGVMDGNFMKLGPGDHSKVMGVTLDSWYKWSCIAVFTFVSTSINAFVGDAIMPWVQNTIQDYKGRYLPYSKAMCILITQIWTLYCCVMSVFALFVMLSQVDFLLIRICADMLVNMYTSLAFMRDKTVDPQKYYAWTRMESAGGDTLGGDSFGGVPAPTSHDGIHSHDRGKGRDKGDPGDHDDDETGEPYKLPNDGEGAVEEGMAVAVTMDPTLHPALDPTVDYPARKSTDTLL
eukprot:767707-Hanusia_phi.AAC.1